MISKPCNFLRMLGSSLERVNDNCFLFHLITVLIDKEYILGL